MGKFVITFLIAVFALAVVAADDIDTGLRNMFEHYISEMDDPMHVESLDVDGFDAFGLVSLDGDINDLRIAGIHNIRLDNIQFHVTTLECDVDIVVPGLVMGAKNYDLSGRFGALIPIFGKGAFNVDTQNIRVRGTARLAVDNDGYVSMSAFRSVVSMDSLTCNFENLLMGGELGDLMNYVIGDMIPFVLRNQQSEVTDVVEELVLEVANEYLDGKTLEELLLEIMEFL